MTEESKQTPTQKVLENIWDDKTVVDSLGRTIHLKSPDPLDKYNLYRAMGEESSIDACANVMSYILFVKRIDSINFSTPLTNAEAKASLKILGNAGIAALHEHIEKYCVNTDGVDEVKK